MEHEVKMEGAINGLQRLIDATAPELRFPVCALIDLMMELVAQAVVSETFTEGTAIAAARLQVALQELEERQKTGEDVSALN